MSESTLPPEQAGTITAGGLMACDLPALANWSLGRDTGVSSKFMAAVAMCGEEAKTEWLDATPADAPDLGRCVRLIEKVPSVRNCFPLLRETSPVWAGYLDHWDELTALWHQGDYHVTTARMREIRNAQAHAAGTNTSKPC